MTEPNLHELNIQRRAQESVRREAMLRAEEAASRVRKAVLAKAGLTEADAAQVRRPEARQTRKPLRPMPPTAKAG
jgi:hypothetical protein